MKKREAYLLLISLLILGIIIGKILVNNLKLKEEIGGLKVDLEWCNK